MSSVRAAVITVSDVGYCRGIRNLVRSYHKAKYFCMCHVGIREGAVEFRHVSSLRSSALFVVYAKMRGDSFDPTWFFIRATCCNHAHVKMRGGCRILTWFVRMTACLDTSLVQIDFAFLFHICTQFFHN